MKIFILVTLLVLFETPRSYSDISIGSMSPSQGITLSTSILYGGFGSSLRNAGDFNGDGYDDVVIGSFNANQSSGIVYVIFGRATGLSSFDVSSGMTAS